MSLKDQLAIAVMKADSAEAFFRELECENEEKNGGVDATEAAID